MITIRDARLADLDHVARLWTGFLAEQASLDSMYRPSADAERRFRADFPEWIHDSSRLLLVATVDTRVVGFVSARLWSLPPIFEGEIELFVEYLYVDPDYRRAGTGRALVNDASTAASRWGASRIRLAVAEKNVGGRGFWSTMDGTTVSREMLIEIEPVSENQPHRRIGFAGNP